VTGHWGPWNRSRGTLEPVATGPEAGLRIVGRQASGLRPPVARSPGLALRGLTVPGSTDLRTDDARPPSPGRPGLDVPGDRQASTPECPERLRCDAFLNLNRETLVSQLRHTKC